VQGGDATGTGDGCESIYGQPYPDEVHPRLKFRYRGMMGVASAGRGTKTNGSQFFIAMGRLPSLDGKHTLFGKVVGQTIYNLVRLNEVEVDKNDIPVDPPRIVRAELVWDPFGDLEPRYKVGGPSKPLKDKDEHRRAPVHKKNVLSFAEDCSEEEEEEKDEATAAPGGKVKSAHDVLNDPRLLREVAYPEEVAEKKSLRD
ncbi:CYP57, partial [Symbiodinium sp. KB8]